MIMCRSLLCCSLLTIAVAASGCADGPRPPDGYPVNFRGTVSWTIRFDDGGSSTHDEEDLVFLYPTETDGRWNITLGPCAGTYSEGLVHVDGVLLLREAPPMRAPQCEWDTVAGGHLTFVFSRYSLYWYPDRLEADFTGFVMYELDGSVREGDIRFNYYGTPL